MRKVVAIVGVLALSAPAWADEESPGFGRKGIEVSGGLGGGEYVYRPSIVDPTVTVPYRELGAGVRVGLRPRVVVGVNLSIRADEPMEAVEPVINAFSVNPSPGSSNGPAMVTAGDDDVIAAGTRWRLAPYAEYRVRALRLRGGIVAGNYYNPMDSEKDTVWIYPQAMIGMGSDEFAFELGFMDAPPLASSANGGLGVVALRTSLRLVAGHRATFGIGAPYAGPGSPDGNLGGTPDTGGYLSYAYQGEIGETFTIDLGGYTSTVTTGVFVGVGKKFN